ncbi:MAG: hypothetical protein WD572_04995 [Gammaproteobacteria bacterium]
MESDAFALRVGKNTHPAGYATAAKRDHGASIVHQPGGSLFSAGEAIRHGCRLTGFYLTHRLAAWGRLLDIDF